MFFIWVNKIPVNINVIIVPDSIPALLKAGIIYARFSPYDKYPCAISFLRKTAAGTKPAAVLLLWKKLTSRQP